MRFSPLIYAWLALCLALGGCSRSRPPEGPYARWLEHNESVLAVKQEGSFNILAVVWRSRDGASLGTSTAAPIMLKVIQKSSLKDKLETPEWRAKMREMVPSYGRKLNPDQAFAKQIRQQSNTVLGMKAIALEVPAVAAVAPAAEQK